MKRPVLVTCWETIAGRFGEDCFLSTQQVKGRLTTANMNVNGIAGQFLWFAHNSP